MHPPPGPATTEFANVAAIDHRKKSVSNQSTVHTTTIFFSGNALPIQFLKKQLIKTGLDTQNYGRTKSDFSIQVSTEFLILLNFLEVHWP